MGADLARNPIDAREVAERTIERAIAEGNQAPEVRERLLELRAAVGRRPLDTKTRVAYASVLLGMSRRTLHRKLKQWPDLDVR